ncbi:MAG: radical SAM protein, partial [Bdellovibrionales bacterium]
DDTITAFHANTMEVAEISDESFEEMTDISILTGEIPPDRMIQDAEAFDALNGWNNDTNPQAKSGKLNFGIRSITININQICNLKCAYCEAGGDGTYGEALKQISVEKTLPQLKFFLSALKPGAKFSISFVGGEPLLHPLAIKAIYDYVTTEAQLRNITPIMKIVTNGTLIKDDTLSILRLMNLHLTISIDGVKKYNDMVRPSKDGKSTTDKILAGLQELSKDRGLIKTITLSAITTKGNENLVENYYFFKELNPDAIEFVFANDEKSEEIQKKFITQMNEIAAIAWAKGQEAELRKINNFDHYFRLLDRQIKIENHCGAGKSYLMVDAKNRLYSCVWDANNKKDIVGQNEQLDPAAISKYSKSLIELNNCQTCWARHLCGGGCMHINRSHSGDKHQKNLLFCERTRSLILTTLLYYKRARAANT